MLIYTATLDEIGTASHYSFTYFRCAPSAILFCTVQGYRVQSQPQLTSMYRFAKAAVTLSGKAKDVFTWGFFLILSFHLRETVELEIKTG